MEDNLNETHLKPIVGVYNSHGVDDIEKLALFAWEIRRLADQFPGREVLVVIEDMSFNRRKLNTMKKNKASSVEILTEMKNFYTNLKPGNIRDYKLAQLIMLLNLLSDERYSNSVDILIEDNELPTSEEAAELERNLYPFVARDIFGGIPLDTINNHVSLSKYIDPYIMRDDLLENVTKLSLRMIERDMNMINQISEKIQSAKISGVVLNYGSLHLNISRSLYQQNFENHTIIMADQIFEIMHLNPYDAFIERVIKESHGSVENVETVLRKIDGLEWVKLWLKQMLYDKYMSDFDIQILTQGVAEHLFVQRLDKAFNQFESIEEIRSTFGNLTTFEFVKKYITS